MANRNFVIGNHSVSEYDPEIGGEATVVSQVGPETYTAKITTSKYDPIEEVTVAAEYPLVLGVVKVIDVDSSTTVKLVCAPIGTNTFSDGKNGSGKNIPAQSTAVLYTLTTAEVTGDDTYGAGGRQFIIKTASADPDTITVGDTIEYDPVTGFDKVTQTGVATYSAAMLVSVYDPVAEEFQTYTTEIPLGVPTVVDFKKGVASSQVLVCNTFTGKQFSGASNGLIEVPYERYTLSYALTDPELPPNPNSSRQYLIQTINDTVEPIPEPTVTNNYRLTREELKEFQKQIYASQVPGDTRKPAWEFVSNVFLVPFVVPATEILQRENIKARDITFNIADRLKGNSIAIPLGTIDIPGRYGNSLDYQGANVALYLPFKSGEIDLDPYQVINGAISLEYMVNPSDGNTTLNIYIENGELIQTSTFKMGSEYPFYSYSDIQDKLYSPENVVNLIRSAYVVVKIPNYEGVTIPKVTISGLLGDTKGRVEFSDVVVNGIPYANEYDELISKLKGGVFIK